MDFISKILMQMLDNVTYFGMTTLMSYREKVDRN